MTHYLDIAGGALVGGFLVFCYETRIIRALKKALLEVRTIDKQITNPAIGKKTQ